MATAGNDGATTYQTNGAGGKFRKRPIRRSVQTTPYDRPVTTAPLRNNNNNNNNNNSNNASLLSKLVDPASRLIYAGADRLFGVFRKRVPSVVPVPRLQGTSEEPRNRSHEAVPNSALNISTEIVEPSPNESGKLASFSDATQISDLESMLKQKTFTRSEIERLTSLLLSKTTESNVVEEGKEKLPSTSYHVPRPEFTSGTMNKHLEERGIENFDAVISTPLVNSRASEIDVASPADLAKAYMGTISTKVSPLTIRPSSQSLRKDSALFNNTTNLPKTPTTSLVPKFTTAMKTNDNSFTTPRSRGRSALYNMPRTPYYRGPSTLSQKGVASPSASENEGFIGSSRMAAKRRSSALDDIGSGGPMRRIRQKASLLSQQSSSQKLLIRNEPESKGKQIAEESREISKRDQSYGSVPTESSQMALKIFEQLDRMSPKEKVSVSKLAGTAEKIVSPKLLSSSQDNVKPAGQNRVLFPDAHEPTFSSKDTVNDNGSRNITGHSNVTSLVNGNITKPIKDGAATKQAFSMSVHEDASELVDRHYSNGNLSISPAENKRPGKSVFTNDFSTSANAEIIKTQSPSKAVQTVQPEVDTISGIPEFKKRAVSPGGSVPNKQKTSYSFLASTSSPNSNTQPKSTIDSVTPQNKATVQSTFGISASNSAGPSGVKPNSSPDARLLGSTSLINNSTIYNNQVQISASASNKDDNGNTANLKAASESGTLLFGGSTKDTAIVNGTPAPNSSVFATSSSHQPSGANTNMIFGSSSSPVLSSTATTTVPASIFSTGFTTASSVSASLKPASPFATSSNGGSIFGFSSTSATSPTNGFQVNTQASSNAATQVPVNFGSGTSVMSSSTSASSLFSSSAPSFGLTSAVTSEIKSSGSGSTSGSTTNIFSSGFTSAPSFGLSSTVASSEAKSGSSVTNPFGSTPSFGHSSTVASSETKSGSSTSNIFGSTPFAFGASSTSAPLATTSPFVFGSSNAGSSTTSSVFSFASKASSPAPAFGNPAPVFGVSPTNNNDHMSMEDSMVDDANRTPSPSVSPFAQASSGTPGFMFGSATTQTPPSMSASGTPGFMFGSATTQPPPPSMSPFQFGGTSNQSQPPSQNPFQAPGGSPFNAGGSFSLGSGGEDKSSRRIVKVKRQNRKR